MAELIVSPGPLEVRRLLRQRLDEQAPGRIQLLAGPRQVGKTTLLLELQRELGPIASYAAADAPEATLPGFWDRFWGQVESAAGLRGRAVALLDEAHVLPNWAASLKSRWDRIRRLRLPIHVIVTGSSALGMAHGSRESLAGRFERLVFAHWSVAAVAETFDIPTADAARDAVLFGTYPGAWPLRGDPVRWRAYVRDAIVEPAIGRDVIAMAQVRKPALLRQVFAASVAAPAAIVSLQKLQGQLSDPGALETIAGYLLLLQDAFLVAAIDKYSTRAIRRRASPPKLITLNNAFLSAVHPDGPPDEAADPARFGLWVENACLAAAINRGEAVTYWREEPLEVDGVVEGRRGAWAVEIKTSAFDRRDLTGLLEFTSRHRKFRPIVVTRPGDEGTARQLGLDAISWVDFLATGLPVA